MAIWNPKSEHHFHLIYPIESNIQHLNFISIFSSKLYFFYTVLANYKFLYFRLLVYSTNCKNCKFLSVKKYLCWEKYPQFGFLSFFQGILKESGIQNPPIFWWIVIPGKNVKIGEMLRFAFKKSLKKLFKILKLYKKSKRRNI